MLGHGSTSLIVPENGLAQLFGIAATVDTDYSPSDLTVTVMALPSHGTMLLPDGVTPVSLGQNVTLAQFTTLTFRPAMHGDSNGLRFGFAVVGAEGEAGSRHPIKSASAQPPANWLVLNLPQNSKPRLIGIPAPADFDYPISESCVRITELPSNGIVLLSDGTTVVGQGQTLTVAQLTGLMFRSAASASGQISSLSYSISGSAGETFAACVLLVVGPATPALCTPIHDGGAGNNIVTSIAIAALLEATLSSSGLAASALPTEEPSDAGTQQSDAQNPNVAQVTGEMQPLDLLAQASNLETDATNSTSPSTTATDSAPARNVGSSSLPLATTPASTSILQGNGATEIKAPSDVAVSFLQSTVAADVLLAPLMNAAAPTAGNSLIAPQLTSLSVTPTPGNTSQTSTSAPTASASSTSASFAALAAGSNAIALENMKQGTPESEWLIDRGDPSIEGFAAQFTINHGQRVDFKINTNSTNYRIDIYRIGYYNGDGARKVATIDRNLATAQVQPAPLFDSTRRLVDAGNWSVSASWNIPADAVSGVYFAKLTNSYGVDVLFRAQLVA
jgi:hypothetical protein